MFVAQRWLDKREGDGEIEVELHLDQGHASKQATPLAVHDGELKLGNCVFFFKRALSHCQYDRQNKGVAFVR